MSARATLATWFFALALAAFAVVYVRDLVSPSVPTPPDPALVARADSLDAVREALARTQAALAHVRDSVARIAAADAAERRRTRTTLSRALATLDSLRGGVAPVDTTAADSAVSAVVRACVADAAAADRALASCAAERAAVTHERDNALARVATSDARVATSDSLRAQAERAEARARQETRRERVLKWGALLAAFVALVLR